MAPICGVDECEEQHDYSENLRYGKEKEHAENIAYRFGYGLELIVLRATNIDELSGAFLPTRRKMMGLYSVVLGMQNGPDCKTRVTIGDYEPIWDQQFNVLLDESTVCGFLDLELIDENHDEDPRSSQGRAVVGRARVALPEDFGVVETRRAELVKEAGDGNTVVGYIHLKWRLSRLHAGDLACLN